jgi:hypothetical protein
VSDLCLDPSQSIHNTTAVSDRITSTSLSTAEQHEQEIPEFPKFASLSKKHHSAIYQRTLNIPAYSDFTAPNLWCWNFDQAYTVSTLDGVLVLRMTDYVNNKPFLTLLGQAIAISTIRNVLYFLNSSSDLLPYLKLIPEHCLPNEVIPNDIEITEDLDNHDYVYQTEDLINLSGNRYRELRWLANQFRKKYSPEIVELDLTDSKTQSEVEDVCHLWVAEKKRHHQTVDNDLLALMRFIQKSDWFAHQAFGVRVDNALLGYAIFELNHNHNATNIFEHADKTFHGIFPYLMQQSALRLRQLGYQLINHQQDLGLIGLRASKQKYRPFTFRKKYTISLKAFR